MRVLRAPPPTRLLILFGLDRPWWCYRSVLRCPVSSGHSQSLELQYIVQFPFRSGSQVPGPDSTRGGRDGRGPRLGDKSQWYIHNSPKDSVLLLGISFWIQSGNELPLSQDRGRPERGNRGRRPTLTTVIPPAPPPYSRPGTNLWSMTSFVTS